MSRAEEIRRGWLCDLLRDVRSSGRAARQEQRRTTVASASKRRRKNSGSLGFMTFTPWARKGAT